MYRGTSSQTGFWASDLRLDAGVIKRMEASWAGEFLRRVWPVLLELEPEFRVLYSHQGRPTFSIARKLGVMLLREMRGVESDEQSLECLQYDLLWQYALGISHPNQAQLTRRSLVDFRSRIARHDLKAEEQDEGPTQSLLVRLFNAMAQKAIEDLGISVSNQRMDSTFVQSNMKRRGRQALMRDSIRGLLKQVDKTGKLIKVSEELRTWYQEAPHWERSQCTVEQTIEWMTQLLKLFAEDEELSQSEEFGLLMRIFNEQVTIAENTDEAGEPRADETATFDGEPTSESQEASGDEDASDEPITTAQSNDEAHEPQNPAGLGEVASLDMSPDDAPGTSEESEQNPDQDAMNDTPSEAGQADSDADPEKTEGQILVMRPKSEPDAITSTTDPDARRGHKGTGYLAHIVETCGNDGSSEIITDVVVVPANTSDKTQLVEALERLQAKGMAPESMHVDGGYYTPDNLEQAHKQDITLNMPVNRSGMSEDDWSRSNFLFDEAGHVIACPEGHRPVLHKIRTSSAARTPALHAVFNRATCDSCPSRSRCPVANPSSKTGDCFLAISFKLRLRDEAWEKQKSEDWQRLYRLRSGIESSNSELKRVHKARRLMVRGLSRVSAALLLKTAACNIKRWLRQILAHVASGEFLRALLCLLIVTEKPSNANSRHIARI